jgi:thiol-disulfide isomerase/thioredoxin
LDGGELALSELRGLLVLLVFSSPHCGPCNALAPKLEKFYRPKRRASRFGRSSARPAARRPGPAHSAHGREGDEAFGFELVMISRESPEANRAKVKEQGLTFPVVLQQQWEVSRSYAFFATPAAYLVDETGVIAADVAVGVDAVLELTTRAARMLRQDGKALRRPLLRRLTGWMAKAA